MIKVEKERDRVFITITSQLDREDVYQLVSDLSKWLEDTVEVPNFKGISEDKVREAFNGPSRMDVVNSAPTGIQFHNKEHEDAFTQAQSKRLLEEQMKYYIASIKPTQHIQKEVTTIELDALNREVEITKTKLKQNGK